MKKILLPLFFILLFYFLPILFEPTINELIEQERIDFLKLNFNGKVVAKFNDKLNHNIKTLILSERDQKDTLLIYYENSTFFRKVSIGDSVFKSNNSLNVKSKKDTVENNYILNWDY